MRILTDTPDRLVIEHRPLLLALALVALTLLLLYAAMASYAEGDTGKALFVLAVTLLLMGPSFWFAVERVQVIFDRRARTYTLRKRRLAGDQFETHPLDTVTRAMVQTHKGNHEDPDCHRVALVLGADRLENRHGLTHSYRSGQQARQVVGRINAWLDSARSTA
ncbi:hypothetical protein [uncultured Roseobacter sp.]|uniref:hypothetical protein n=1 Tax=uncultured Roseobacter sp. TaxID=114847 RepID=UPI00262D1512|nr:hypothetical protein [uncultured Roseobacter sp.]